MKKITSMMGDYTMAIMNADAVGFDAVSAKYDLVADRTFHREVGLAATPSPVQP